MRRILRVLFIGFKAVFRRLIIMLPLIILLVISVFIFKASLRQVLYKYDTFQTAKFDLGWMTQTVWNTAHGRFFQFTDHFGTNTNQAISHTDYLMVIFVPLFWIWNDPRVLLYVQVIILISTVIPIYLLVKHKTKSNWLGLIWGTIFLLYPAIGFLLISEFHSVTLVIPLFIWSFYFLEKDWRVPFWIVLTLALLGKEEISLLVILFGLYIAWFRKKIKLGYAVTICGVVWAIISFGVIIPSFGNVRVNSFSSFIKNDLGGQYNLNRTGNSQNFFLARYDQFGDSYSAIALNIVSKPLYTLSYILSADNRDYLLQVFGPLAFIPLLNPLILLISSPEFAVNLLSNNGAMKDIKLQYVSSIVPFLFVATIFFLASLRRKLPPRLTSPVLFLLSVIILISCVWASANLNSPLWPYIKQGGPLVKIGYLVNKINQKGQEAESSESLESELNQNEVSASSQYPSSNDLTNANNNLVVSKSNLGDIYDGVKYSNPKASDTAETVLKLIPEKASVSAPNFLGANLALRESESLFPANYKNADDVVIDLSSDQFLHSVDDFDVTPLIPRYVCELLNNPDYKLKYFGNSLMLFERAVVDDVKVVGPNYQIETSNINVSTNPSINYNYGLSLSNYEVPNEFKIDSTSLVTLHWNIYQSFKNQQLIITTNLINKDTRQTFQIVNLGSYCLKPTNTWDKTSTYIETMPINIPAYVKPGIYDVVIGISDFENKNNLEARYIKQITIN